MKVLISLFITSTFIGFQDFITADTQQWTDFKANFNKKYTTDEDQKRMKIYQDNLKKISEHNKLYEEGKVGFKLDTNDYTDLTDEEFTKKHSLQENLNVNLDSNFLAASKLQQTDRDPYITTSLPPNLGKAPETKNWVEEGAVTEVKDQGHCSSCWAFVTVGAIEGQMAIHRKKKESLSAQNLIDCVGIKEGRMNDCDIGNEFYAFQYVMNNGGIESELNYPYEEKQNTCQYRPEDKGATISTFHKVEQFNEALLKEVVGLIGPVTCAINIAYPFRFYNYGVYDSETCKKEPESLTHAVLIVGYGTDKESGKDYWLCKNQWGISWGEKGYIRLARNSNTCGITTFNFYPVL